MKLTVIGRSINKTEIKDEELSNNLFNAKNLRKDLTIMAGKAAGICYMPDDYLSNGIQDEEKALKRAEMNAVSGHYSTYEHGHINFMIECDKMMCIILNSVGLYSTSEKSSRYTAMTPETILEKGLYKKWEDIFTELISVYHKDYNEKQTEKLAMENARYMISVFTPTVMEYTIPFNRAILMSGWLDEMADTITKGIEYRFPNIISNLTFYKRISSECKEMAAQFRLALGMNKDEPILEDHKKIGIELFSILSAYYKLDGICNVFTDPQILQSYEECIPMKATYYGDSYTSNYYESIAAFAQAERHRTIHYSIDLPKKLDCYVPKIIRGSRYEVEWRNDFNQLIENGTLPQGTLVKVCEQGRFEDFVLKCKERLCSRAQLEIMEVTRDQVAQFASHKVNLGLTNIRLLEDMIELKPGENPNSLSSIIVKSKCRYKNYICKEPCAKDTYMMNYFRNI